MSPSPRAHDSESEALKPWPPDHQRGSITCSRLFEFYPPPPPSRPPFRVFVTSTRLARERRAWSFQDEDGAATLCRHPCGVLLVVEASLGGLVMLPGAASCSALTVCSKACFFLSLVQFPFAALSACCLSLSFVSAGPGIAQVSVPFSCCPPALAAPACEAHLKCC